MIHARIAQNGQMEGHIVNSPQQIAEVEVLGDNVLIIFEPEQAALLTAADLHELAAKKNAFVEIPEDPE
jgi:hypothetical protein